MPRTSSHAARATLLLAALLVWGAAAAHGQSPAAHAVDDCLRCHEEVRAETALAVPHEPAADGACTDCHAPHAARFPHLLNMTERSLCFVCHMDERTAFMQGSIHAPVREGRCTDCHRPHGSEHAGLLTTTGRALCFGCHEAKQEQAAWPTVHQPFAENDCSACHQPHSAPNAFQLVKESTALCLECHDTEGDALTEAHSGIPVEGTHCADCHEPHASTGGALLRPVTHEPFAENSCEMCHMLDSDTPRLVMLTGARLCGMCHDDHPRPDDTVVHAPVASGECGACHTPHASNHEGLLRLSTRDLCLSCHQDLVARREQSRTTHDTDLDGAGCTACHQPHSSTEEHLLSAGPIRTCLNCHENQRHGHPLGTDRMDPRTGRPITCVTCHDPHGTDFPMQLRGDQKRGLCLECHGQDDDARAPPPGR